MAARREFGWKPRSFRLPNGRYISYDGIPGISDLIATTVTVLNNMESLEGSRQEELLNALSLIVGTAVTFSFEENSNYLQVPPEVLGVNKIFKFDGSNTVTNNMFSVKYQLFLNDIYYWGSTEILTYAMTKRYLEDIDFALSTEKMIRFNQRSDRLYLDIDWGSATAGQYIVIDCTRLLDPNDFSRVYNDSFLKKYLTILIKKQWGQNLIKFQGVKLPGGIELNGRQIYDDAQRELDQLMERMSNTYELPPLDMIG